MACRFYWSQKVSINSHAHITEVVNERPNSEINRITDQTSKSDRHLDESTQDDRLWIYDLGHSITSGRAKTADLQTRHQEQVDDPPSGS